MKCPFEDHIHALLVSGRITEATAEILTRHYAKQPDHFKEEMAAAPEEVNLAHLMRLIDLLEKKNEARKTSSAPPEPLPPQENIPETSSQPLPGTKEETPASSGTSSWEAERERLETQYAELKKKYESLEAELVAVKGSQQEFEEKAFAYAKKYADAEEERRRVQVIEDNKRKALEEEHQRLLEEVHRAKEGEKQGLVKTLEGHSADLVALGQEKERLAKELEKNHEEQSKALARIRDLEQNTAQAEGLRKRCFDLEEELKREKERLARELEKSHEEKDKALARVKELEAHGAQGEGLKKRCADLEEELKKETELRAKIQTQFQALEKTLLDLERQINALS